MRVSALVILLLSATVAFGQTASIPEAFVVPQVAIGGDADGLNYVTLLQLANNNSATINGRLAILSDTGTAVSAIFDGQAPQTTLDITLASGEARQIQITFSGIITAGSLVMTFSPAGPLATVILQVR